MSDPARDPRPLDPLSMSNNAPVRVAPVVSAIVAMLPLIATRPAQSWLEQHWSRRGSPSGGVVREYPLSAGTIWSAPGLGQSFGVVFQRERCKLVAYDAVPASVFVHAHVRARVSITDVFIGIAIACSRVNTRVL